MTNEERKSLKKEIRNEIRKNCRSLEKLKLAIEGKPSKTVAVIVSERHPNIPFKEIEELYWQIYGSFHG